MKTEYNKEIVTIKTIDFECSGHFISGDPGILFNQEVKIKDSEVSEIICAEVREEIEAQIIGRMVARPLVKRLQEIEREWGSPGNYYTIIDPTSIMREKAAIVKKLDELCADIIDKKYRRIR